MIELYSNGCPVCTKVEKMLVESNIKYTKTDNFSEPMKQGFRTAPVIKFKDTFLASLKAIELIKDINLGKVVI